MSRSVLEPVNTELMVSSSTSPDGPVGRAGESARTVSFLCSRIVVSARALSLALPTDPIGGTSPDKG